MRRQCCQVWGVGSSQVSCSQFSHEDLLVMWSYLFQKRPNMREDFQKKLFLFFCWHGYFSLTPDRQQVLLLGPPFNATANLSSLVHVQVLEPFSLYKKAVTSICCLSPRPGAQRSSEVDCKFFQLTQCGVFLTFEENISREEIPSLPSCC